MLQTTLHPKHPYLRAGFMLGVEDGVVCLVDKCNEFGTMSITNDAENVIRYLCETGAITGNDTIVIYKDTEGMWDRMLHRDSKFTGYWSLGGERVMKQAVAKAKQRLA